MLAIVLSVILLLGAMLPVAAAAAETNTPKQEVVYINLNADGSVEKIYVVNIFELDSDGKIIDYGDYTALRNMTTNDEIQFENETVRIDTKAEKLYYEGILSNHSIPWDFSIQYCLDGKEYQAQELAGKSGAFQLKLSIRQNADCDSSFFDNYSLQAAITLDTEKCKNIVADGATAANVGGDRQLSYMILPGKETDITVTADVTDFEMTGIAINGIPLSMDVDVDIEDNTELNEQVAELSDGVAQLDEGANELKDGASDLKDGASELTAGAGELKDGACALADGAGDLQTGASRLVDGATALNSSLVTLKEGTQQLLTGAADVKDGASTLNDAIREAVDGADTLTDGIDDLKSGAQVVQTNLNSLSNGLSNLSGKSGELTGGAYAVFQQLCAQAGAQLNAQLAANGMNPVTLTPENYADTLSGLIEQLNAISVPEAVVAQISALKAQLDSYQTYYQGLQDYTGGVDSAAVGAQALCAGCGDLLTGIDNLQAGAQKLDAGLQEIESGSANLLAGTITLHNGATNLSNGVVALGDGSAELLSGAVALEDGTVELYDGAIALKDGSIELLDGAIELSDGTVELYDGTITLTDGTFEFKDKTSDLKTKLSDKIKDAVDDMLGGDFDVRSFVSEKNTQVESVQFVIKTPSIEMEDEEVEKEPAAEPNFWQRFLKLFGLYDEE